MTETLITATAINATDNAISTAVSSVQAEEVTGVIEDVIIDEEDLDSYEEFDDNEVVSSEDCLDFVDELDKPRPDFTLTGPNTDKDSARQILIDIIGTNKNVLRDALKLMDKEDTKKRNTDKRSAKQYHYCTVLTTCDHCGVTSERIVTLDTQSESFVYISEHNKVNIVTFKTIEQPCTFIAKTTFCGSCYDYIQVMSRYELEERYIKLLKGE